MPRKTFTAGQVLAAADVNTFLVNNGYQLLETLYLTSSGTFTKADYPLLRAIRVKALGGGGGGAGASTTSVGHVSIGGAGAGGSGAEVFISDLSLLAETETVTVGAGGAFGAAGANNGSDGGESSFGAFCVAPGGGGGFAMASTAVPTSCGIPGEASRGTTGDILYGGSSSLRVIAIEAIVSSTRLQGGHSAFDLNATRDATGPGNGLLANGAGTGGGGGGNLTNNGTARAGAVGANGYVIVELYA